MQLLARWALAVMATFSIHTTVLATSIVRATFVNI
uniref:Uncharacterized protein n=1 Tax=Parascaris equorum TaxID=6256 RepID=A0A914S5Q4_PAREQ